MDIFVFTLSDFEPKGQRLNFPFGRRMTALKITAQRDIVLEESN
ncbi:hypothetical protein [Marinicrinis lubricantis]|uniref:Uncharacterized protein n=1 Tax=Marinicrinis lubricantis TaxID=2086470 RepID=A0ABW1IR85_9BACL